MDRFRRDSLYSPPGGLADILPGTMLPVDDARLGLGESKTDTRLAEALAGT